MAALAGEYLKLGGQGQCGWSEKAGETGDLPALGRFFLYLPGFSPVQASEKGETRD